MNKKSGNIHEQLKKKYIFHKDITCITYNIKITYHYQIKYNRKSRISQYFIYLLAIQSCLYV